MMNRRKKKYLEFNKTKSPAVKGVVGIIIEKDGKVLITKRSANMEKEPGKWCFPGGHIDIGETALTAAKREAKEETGFTVKDVKFIRYYDEFLPQIKTHSLLLMFHAAGFSGKPNKNAEVSLQKWIGKNDVKKINFAFIHKKIAEDFFKGK